MLVAISVATGLYLAALYLHPRKNRTSDARLSFYICLALSSMAIYRIPAVSGTPQFLTTLLWMHAFLLLPFISFPSARTKSATPTNIPETKVEASIAARRDETIYRILGMGAFLSFITNTVALTPAYPPGKGIRWMYDQAFSHPAQGSISMDVIWSAFTVVLWYLVSGSFGSTVIKCLVLTGIGAGFVMRHYGVNWTLVASVLPIIFLLASGVTYLAIARARSKNIERRKVMMEEMGIKENVVLPGTKNQPPSKAGRKLVVGFWHPYW